MAKSSITNISTTNTFQVWLNKTNELVDLVKNDILTASLATANGDITIGNATLQGNFTANNIVVETLLRVDNISPKVGSTIIEASSPINITTNQIVLSKLSSTSGPRISLFDSGDTDWQIGFENNTNKNFIITNGAGLLRLLPNGNLEISGTFAGTAQIANTVSLLSTNTTNAAHFPTFVDTATGNEQIRTDSGFTYNPSTGILTATGFSGTFAGNITGDVSGNLTGNVTGNVTGSLTGNVTGNVSGNAGTVTNGVYTTGNQTIAGLKTFSNNITTSAITSGGFTDQDTTNAAIYGAILQSGSSYAPIIKIRSTGSTSVTTSSFGVLHNVDNTQEAVIHLIQGSDANNRIWRFSETGTFTSPGDVAAFSDERLKTNINTIKNPLDKVLALRGVSFEKDGKSSIGVIAQEIEKVIPEVVHDGEYKSVAYGNLVGLLIEAIKELKEEIESLKKDN